MNEEHEWGSEMTPTTSRPDWGEYFMEIARAVSARADCRRAKYGAILVKDWRIVSTGYNGSPPGGPSCLKGECPRGLKSHEELAHNSPGYSDCIALHAEQNCIAYANREDSNGAVMFIAGGMPPCDMCLKLLKAAGVYIVFFEQNGEMKGEMIGPPPKK